MDALIVSEHIFIASVACTKHNQLSTVSHYIIHSSVDYIKTFLISKSGYNTHKVCIWIFRKSQLSLKCKLVLQPVLLKCPEIVFCFKSRICLRIIGIIVDTIYNAPERLPAGLKQAVQSFSIIWSLNLMGIGI